MECPNCRMPVTREMYFCIHCGKALPRSGIFEQVKAIIVNQLGVDESRVTPQARFREDLEADSLDLVELIMAFEEEFGGEISDEEAQKISTVGDAIAYLEAKVM